MSNFKVLSISLNDGILLRARREGDFGGSLDLHALDPRGGFPDLLHDDHRVGWSDALI